MNESPSRAIDVPFLGRQREN